MNWYGGGLVCIINYSYMGETALQDDTILTENNFDIMTEASQELLRET